MISFFLLSLALADDAVTFAGWTTSRAPNLYVDLHAVDEHGAMSNVSTRSSVRDPLAPLVEVVPGSTAMELVVGVAESGRSVTRIALVEGRSTTVVFSTTTRLGEVTLPSTAFDDGYLPFLVTYSDGTSMVLGVELTTSTGTFDPSSGRALNPQPEPPGYPASFVLEFDITSRVVPTVAAQLDGVLSGAAVSFR